MITTQGVFREYSQQLFAIFHVYKIGEWWQPSRWVVQFIRLREDWNKTNPNAIFVVYIAGRHRNQLLESGALSLRYVSAF